MALVDLVMPKMGESIMEATILKWYKKAGDPVKMDETVLEIATDKVDSEVPSTAEGVMEEVLYNVNDVVPVGAVIARIRSGVAESAHIAPVVTPSNVSDRKPQYATASTGSYSHQPASTTSYRPQTNGSANRFYSPLVLNIAANEGVSMSELENITGSGNEGRLTKKDILQYVDAKKNGRTTSPRETVQQGGHVTVHTHPEPNIMQVKPEQQLQTIYSGNV